VRAQVKHIDFFLDLEARQTSSGPAQKTHSKLSWSGVRSFTLGVEWFLGFLSRPSSIRTRIQQQLQSVEVEASG